MLYTTGSFQPMPPHSTVVVQLGYQGTMGCFSNYRSTVQEDSTPRTCWGLSKERGLYPNYSMESPLTVSTLIYIRGELYPTFLVGKRGKIMGGVHASPPKPHR